MRACRPVPNYELPHTCAPAFPTTPYRTFGTLTAQSTRGPSLMEQHKTKRSKMDEEPEVVWDRDSMLGVGGLLSEEQREKKLKDARNLGDRFAHGKSGAYL